MSTDNRHDCAFAQWRNRANQPRRGQLAGHMDPHSSAELRHIVAGRGRASVAMVARIETGPLGIEGIEPVLRTKMREKCASCPSVAAALSAAAEDQP